MKMTPIAAAVGAGVQWHDLSQGRQHKSRVLEQWVARNGAARRLGREPSRRGYAGAQLGRTVSDWVANSTSADSELYTSLRTLRNRSRQLVRDNEYATHAVERVLPNNIVGQGVRFQAQVLMRRGNRLDERINTRIETKWENWKKARYCHTAGRLSFQDIERMIARCLPEAGEILVRLVTQSFGGSKIPLGLEIIEADQLVDNWSGRTHEGREVRMGVEVDQWQRPVAYWLYPRHPGDFTIASTAPSNDWIRVPADEIIHVALFDRPMQTRGVPWLHSVLVKLRHMGGYEEAEIVRARASASVMGFIESPEIDFPGPGEGGGGMPADDVVDGEKVFDFSPGTIKELAPGEKFSGFAPTSANAALDPFMRFMLRSVAAGTGISYESLSRDYSQSNYSSSRLALTEDRDNYRVLQAWLIRTFHQRVFEKWLDLAVLAGELDLPAYETAPEIYQAVRWSPRGWDWIDPVKEVTAYKAAVRAGFMTADDVIAAKGGDIEDVYKRLRRERDLAEEYDLVLECDPAQTSDKGAPAAGAAGDPAAGQEDKEPGEKSDEDEKVGAEEKRRRRRLLLEEQQERLLLRAVAIDEEIDALR